MSGGTLTAMATINQNIIGMISLASALDDRDLLFVAKTSTPGCQMNVNHGDSDQMCLHR